MRRYPPHNTNVQSWSFPPPRARWRALSSYRAVAATVRSALALVSAPAPAQGGAPPAFLRVAEDGDVFAEQRAAALRRWLMIDGEGEGEKGRKDGHRGEDEDEEDEEEGEEGDRLHFAGKREREQGKWCEFCGQTMWEAEAEAEEEREQGKEPTNEGSAWILRGDVLWQILSLGLCWVLYVIMALIRWARRLKKTALQRAALRASRTTLRGVLAAASNYSTWYAAAAALDEVEGVAGWRVGGEGVFAPVLCEECATFWDAKRRKDAAGSYAAAVEKRIEAVCDSDMIEGKLNELAMLYRQGDDGGLAFALRASLNRNLGGMCHPELHSNSLVGTIATVEDYVDVVSFLLAHVAKTNTPKSLVGRAVAEDGLGMRLHEGIGVAPLPSASGGIVKGEEMSIDDKLTFLNEARHAYGRTALMLSGGAAMGMSHLGVVKALLDQDLLPKVVCGTSAGALVASIVGIFDDPDLRTILATEELINPNTKRPFSFRYFDEHTSTLRRIRRFMRKGYIQDVKMLQNCLRKNYGDLTFEEAYNKTRRILNITVCPARSASDPPLLLNYLTAPHVLIWSAASASCALPLVFAPVELVTKSASGRMVPYHPDGVRWIDGSISSDVPLSRIGELFNVNHFIVSQTNPHVIPRSMPIMHTRAAVLIKSELQFRYWQLLQMGLVPKLLTSIFPHFMQPYAGDVTIMPDVRLSDLTRLLRNPTTPVIADFIRRGETQTFPFVERIRLHCLIEQTLDAAVEFVASAARLVEGDRRATASRPSSPGTRRGSSRFGRVPSWLWLDTRSILSGGAMGVVAGRLGMRGGRGEEERKGSGKELGDEEDVLVGTEKERKVAKVIEVRMGREMGDSSGEDEDAWETGKDGARAGDKEEEEEDEEEEENRVMC